MKFPVIYERNAFSSNLPVDLRETTEHQVFWLTWAMINEKYTKRSTSKMMTSLTTATVSIRKLRFPDVNRFNENMTLHLEHSINTCNSVKQANPMKIKTPKYGNIESNFMNLNHYRYYCCS